MCPRGVFYRHPDGFYCLDLRGFPSSFVKTLLSRALRAVEEDARLRILADEDTFELIAKILEDAGYLVTTKERLHLGTCRITSMKLDLN